MTQEEIEQEFNKLNSRFYGCKHWGIDNPKKKLLTYNYIAEINGKRLEIIKIIKNSCIRKVISNRGLNTNFWAIHRNYNDNLEHKNKNIKIIDFEII